MAATDAKPVPQKNVAYRHYFEIRKNDGTLIDTWSGQDSEVSKDGGDYADATAEATEIQTSGTGYIDLTAAEMNADCVYLTVVVSNTDALPYTVRLYPEEVGDIRVNLTAVEGSATVDGVTLTDLFESFVAFLIGVVDKVGNVYTYNKQDGTTPKFTYTVDDDGRDVA